MCPVQDDPQHHHQPRLPIAGRSHSNSTSGQEGFAIWRGRRIRKDVGSWPCDTIELEVCLPPSCILYILSFAQAPSTYGDGESW
jgi:hypothetical protein